MSLARILVRLQRTNAYLDSNDPLHNQVKTLLTTLRDLNQQERPLNSVDVQKVIYEVDKVIEINKNEENILLRPIQLMHLEDCCTAAKKELQSYLFPFEKFLKRKKKYNVPNIFFENPLQENPLQENLNNLNDELVSKNYKNKNLAKEIIEKLDSIIQQYPLHTAENKEAFILKRTIIFYFFPTMQNLTALYIENSKRTFPNGNDLVYLVAAFDQYIEPTNENDAGNCYGYVRKWARDLLHKKAPFDIKNDINSSTKDKLKNHAHLTEEIVRDQLEQACKEVDNRDDIQIRLGRKLHFSNSDELAEIIVQDATRHPEKPLIITLLNSLDQISFLNAPGHACGIRVTDNTTIEWFDSNQGLYRFPNSDVFKKWFTIKYPDFLRETGLHLYQPFLILSQAEYQALPQTDKKDMKLKGKIRTVLTGEKYINFRFLRFPGFLSVWFLSRKYFDKISELIPKNNPSPEKQPLLAPTPNSATKNDLFQSTYCQLSRYFYESGEPTEQRDALTLQNPLKYSLPANISSEEVEKNNIVSIFQP